MVGQRTSLLRERRLVRGTDSVVPAPPISAPYMAAEIGSAFAIATAITCIPEHRPPVLMAFRTEYERPQQIPGATAAESLVSPRSVTYCCGSCGYALNLRSTDRNTANFGSEYRKSMKKGIVSFVSVDESRFSQVEELRCWPYFESKQSWGLLRKRTKLFCRNCRKFVGVVYEDGANLLARSASSMSGSANGESAWKKYNIKIRALQPSSSDEPGMPLSD